MKKQEDKPRVVGRFAPRVQFLAVQDKIDEFIEQGFSWKAIYDFFSENQAFSMNYTTFCKYMNGSCSLALRQRKKTNTLLPRQAKPQETISASPPEQNEPSPPQTIHRVGASSPAVLGGASTKPIDPRQVNANDEIFGKTAERQ